MRDPLERLKDIIEAINNIERYAAKGRKAFEDDELIQVWIVHHFQIIGESAVNLGKDFQKGNPEILWSKIIGMRNILVHEYFGLDLDEIWNSAVYDLPTLKKQIIKILETKK